MDEDAEDEWFYNSIKRYKQLRMFDCANVVRHIEVSDEAHICVVGRHERSGKDEIMELSLPQKVTVPECDEGLVKDCDMKVQRGCFTKAPVFQMMAMKLHRKLVISEEDQSAIVLYNLNSESSDVIERVHHFPCGHKTPKFSITSSNIAISSTSVCPVEIMDIHTGQITQTFKMTSQSKESQDIVLPEMLSKYVVALCNQMEGTIQLYDIRSNQNISTLHSDFDSEAHQMESKELWTISQRKRSKFGVISSHGKCAVYDMNNLNSPISKSIINELNIQSSSLKSHSLPLLCIGLNTDMVSVSGFNDKVSLYRIKSEEELENVFVHDGHSNRISSENNFVTYHCWFRDDTLISAADDKSIHCWQYVTNKS